MTTINEQDYQNIAKVLEDIKGIYRSAIEIGYEQQERLVLEIIIEYVKIVDKEGDTLSCIQEVCEIVLNEYPKGKFPHDSTLIEEAKSRLSLPYKRVFPEDNFSKDMMTNKLYNAVIEDRFKQIKDLPANESDRYILKKLWTAVNNSLIENPNFKGEVPYYKRHPLDYSHSKKLTLELLDKDFDSYISYFKGE